MIQNIPKIKLGLIAVSRDCFIISLSKKRRNAIIRACEDKNVNVIEITATVENEKDMLRAVEEAKTAGCNALCVLLGNFGPETPETLIAKHFNGPVMYAAAAEEDANCLINDRGDAYCGMLNCSYNLGLRQLKAVIAEYPVGDANDIADQICEFIPVARAVIGIKNLKIITFGPRPQDFFACNAPIKAIYDIGAEVQENSELDLLIAYRNHEGDERIPAIVDDMTRELGKGNQYPDLLPRMAQFELTLLDWAERNRGASKYVVFANKCWPAFPEEFGFVPCYVNSRFASKGMPIACEVDIYGALSEYIGVCVANDEVTLLDINNTVPKDMYDAEIKGRFDYSLSDTFMGFHCGNTPISKLTSGCLNYQLIQNRLLENSNAPDFTRGTLEGDIAPGNITFFRLQSGADTKLSAYIAHGEILPVKTCSFGGIGIFAIEQMARFYRHVLIEKRFPHHGAVAFAHIGKALFTIFKYLGVEEVYFNQPERMLYKSENPFK